MIDLLKRYIVDKASYLKMIPSHLLIEQRYAKFRKMGCVESVA